MYSPELARFISKDPKGYIDGMNLYAYVMNNPLKYLDPIGATAQSNSITEVAYLNSQDYSIYVGAIFGTPPDSLNLGIENMIDKGLEQTNEETQDTFLDFGLITFNNTTEGNSNNISLTEKISLSLNFGDEFHKEEITIWKSKNQFEMNAILVSFSNEISKDGLAIGGSFNVIEDGLVFDDIYFNGEDTNYKLKLNIGLGAAAEISTTELKGKVGWPVTIGASLILKD